MQNLYRLLCRMERDGVRGHIVETGVARGGSAIFFGLFINAFKTRRDLWLYDAFELFDPDGPTSEEVRRTLFETFGFDREAVHLIKGHFETALAAYPEEPIAFLHIDAGGYEPIQCCLERLCPCVEPGGWIVLDNYGADEGCRRATDEYLAKIGRSDALERFGHTQVYFQQVG